MMPQGAGSKLFQGLSQCFLQALPARSPDGETPACPVWPLATQQVSFVCMPGWARHQLLPNPVQASLSSSQAGLCCAGIQGHGCRPCPLWSAWHCHQVLRLWGRALTPRHHSWGSWHHASGWDIPALIINHLYRIVGSRSQMGRFCPHIGQTSQSPVSVCCPLGPASLGARDVPGWCLMCSPPAGSGLAVQDPGTPGACRHP